jgi:hypothetical protein
LISSSPALPISSAAGSLSGWRTPEDTSEISTLPGPSVTCADLHSAASTKPDEATSAALGNAITSQRQSPSSVML